MHMRVCCLLCAAAARSPTCQHAAARRTPPPPPPLASGALPAAAPTPRPLCPRGDVTPLYLFLSLTRRRRLHRRRRRRRLPPPPKPPTCCQHQACAAAMAPTAVAALSACFRTQLGALCVFYSLPYLALSLLTPRQPPPAALQTSRADSALFLGVRPLLGCGQLTQSEKKGRC
jgi:hypothetical protein